MPIHTKEIAGGKILAVNVSGKLIAADYEHFVPEYERIAKSHERLLVLFEMTDFHGWTVGALWQDTKFEKNHFSDVERLALIGEKKWQKGMATFCKQFTQAKVKYFESPGTVDATTWLTESQC